MTREPSLDELTRQNGLPPGYEVEGCPHLPACAGYCPRVSRSGRSATATEKLVGPETEPTPRTRGTTNRNARGSAEDRRRRREWLVTTWRADVDAFAAAVGPSGPMFVPVAIGAGEPACRCYRCGALLTVDTVSPDRIVPGCDGGTYRRSNIRPACERCQSVVGGGTRRSK